MPDFTSRTEMLVGADALAALSRKRAAIFGLGGVGGSAAEALARAGVGSFLLVDGDEVSLTNINRQAVAWRSTLGLAKTDVMRSRILDINPDARVELVKRFIMPGDGFDMLAGADIVLDAIDTVSVKLALAEYCHLNAIPIISAMGCGNRLHPEKLVLTDIFSTSGCGLCRVMRHELRKRGIPSLSVVSSTEEPVAPAPSSEASERRSLPGSTPFVPPAAGLLMASEAFRILTK